MAVRPSDVIGNPDMRCKVRTVRSMHVLWAHCTALCIVCIVLRVTLLARRYHCIGAADRCRTSSVVVTSRRSPVAGCSLVQPSPSLSLPPPLRHSRLFLPDNLSCGYWRTMHGSRLARTSYGWNRQVGSPLIDGPTSGRRGRQARDMTAENPCNEADSAAAYGRT